MESSAQGHNWAAHFLGDVNAWTLLPRLGVSDKTVKHGPARLGPMSDCSANYKLVLSSERSSDFNNQAIVRLKKRERKIWP
jgi:hypothetical protein